MVIEILFLAIYVTLITIGLMETLYYLNFSPLSYYKLWERYCSIDNPYHYVVATLIMLMFFFLLGLLVNKLFPKFNGLKEYIIVAIIIFLLCSFALSFDREMMKKMAFLGQLSFFFTITIAFITFFYSIFYRNLVK